MPFNCNFYCGYFDIYHSGLTRPALFFVTVYIVKISTVLCKPKNSCGSFLISLSKLYSPYKIDYSVVIELHFSLHLSLIASHAQQLRIVLL